MCFCKKKKVKPICPTKPIDPNECAEQERHPLSKMLHGLAGITGRRAKDIGYYVTNSYHHLHKGRRKK